MRQRLVWAATASLAVAAASCSEPTGTETEDRVIIALSASVTGPDWVVASDSSMQVGCEMQFYATASGSGVARLTGYELRLFAGGDRSAPVDVAQGLMSEAQGAFGAATIAPEELLDASYQLTIGVPYALDLKLRYENEPSGRKDSTTVRVRCEPNFPPGAAAPTVDSIVLATTSPVEVGDTVRFTYHISAPAGLWWTSAWVASACLAERGTYEFGAFARTRTVAIAVPPDCPIGDSLYVGVTTTDILFRNVTRLASRRLYPQDISPPTLALGFGPSAQPQPAGDYFVGDRLPLRVAATDQGLLEHLTVGYSTTLRVDTIALAGSAYLRDTTLSIEDHWLGAPSLRFRLRDHAGLQSAEIVTTPGSLRVFPERTDPVFTFPVLSEGSRLETWFRVSEPLNLAITLETRPRVYSLVTGALTRTIDPPTNNEVISMDLAPAGDSLFMYLGNRTLGVIDLSNPSSVAVGIPLPWTADPAMQALKRIHVLSDGRLLLEVRRFFESDSIRLALFDRGAGTYQFLDDISIGDGMSVKDAAGTRLLIRTPDWSCYSILIVADWSLGPPRCSLFWPPGMARNSDRLTHRNSVVDASSGVVTNVEMPDGWYSEYGASALVGDESHLLFGAETEGAVPSLIRARMTDGAVVDRIRLPSPARQIHVTQDGTRAIVFGKDFTISVVPLP